jgi:hypothetical protein
VLKVLGVVDCSQRPERPRIPAGRDAECTLPVRGQNSTLRERLLTRYDPVRSGLETGLEGMSETRAQVFSGFCVLLGRGINRREGKRRMLHW